MMKSLWKCTGHTLLIGTLILTSSNAVFAQTTTAKTPVDPSSVEAQKAECAKNTASEWSASLNRCVGKADAIAARHAVEDCSQFTDVEQIKSCHTKIAEQKTGLSSDINSLPTGTANISLVMNGITTAYTVLGMINSVGSGNKKSSCTSKKIFGVTAVAGVATDIWLKMSAKKKMDELKNKYLIDVKNNAYDAQSKAFEYLKTQQQTVKDIASMEKKRNMLLMLGYGAASVMALYEMTMGQNPECYKKETDAKSAATTSTDTTTVTANAQAIPSTKSSK
jgi:hypothetical protein